jgi:hypothetical protein
MRRLAFTSCQPSRREHAVCLTASRSIVTIVPQITARLTGIGRGEVQVGWPLKVPSARFRVRCTLLR